MDKFLQQTLHGPLGKCLLCERTGTLEKPVKRGLCSIHYSQYIKRFGSKVKELGLAAAEDWDEELIIAGMLLPSAQGRKTKERNLFEEFDTKKNAPADPAVAKDVQAGSEIADKLDAKKKAQPKEVVPEKKPQPKGVKK